MTSCSSCGAAVRDGLDVCPRCGDLVDLHRGKPVSNKVGPRKVCK